MKATTDRGNHVFEVQVYLDGLDPDAVRVELYAVGVNGKKPVRQEMVRGQEQAEANGTIYSVKAPFLVRHRLYARVIPRCDGWLRFLSKRLDPMVSMIQFQGKKAMETDTPITCMFLDIGGVLLTDGWDHHARKRAATNFGLEWAEMEDRHRLMFDSYEEGKLTLQEYLGRVVFYKKRPFTRAQFRRFMFAQSKAFPEMIELVPHLKIRYGLKVAVVSNEARELNAYRIRKFNLDGFVDFFISSCFVHVRKPDPDIFRLALDIAQVPARRVVYIENTPMFVQIAEGLGIQSILHEDYRSTCEKLASLGLHNDEGVIHENR